MAILSKTCKPDHFELHNSLKLSFANIWGLRSNFVACKSFFEWNSPDILALCEINLDDSIDSGNFSVRGFLPLIRKDSSTYMHDLAVMWRRDFLLHGTYLWKTLQIPTHVCFGLALLCSVFNFSFLYQSPSSSLCMVISNDLTQMVNFPTQITDWEIPSIGKFWPCCCLSFHWLSVIFTTECPVSSHSLWLFLWWLGGSL